MLTKRTFEATAKILRENHEEVAALIRKENGLTKGEQSVALAMAERLHYLNVTSFATLFANDNDRFVVERFFDACGIE
jgi:hypothetical protein